MLFVHSPPKTEKYLLLINTELSDAIGIAAKAVILVIYTSLLNLDLNLNINTGFKLCQETSKFGCGFSW